MNKFYRILFVQVQKHVLISNIPGKVSNPLQELIGEREILLISRNLKAIFYFVLIL